MTPSLQALHLLRPAALLLIPIAVGLWWASRRSADPLRGWREQVDPELLSALVVGGRARTGGPSWLVLATWVTAILAISGPTWRLEPSPFADDATPLIVLLKTDASMEFPDPAPSRLARAQLEVADLARARAGQPLGLVVYAGSAHLVLPPTRDTGVVARMAAEVGPEVMPVAGDRLDLGLREAARALGEETRGGSVVVMADGVDGDPETLRALRDELPFDVQFLAVASPGSAEDTSLRAAARALDAPVERLDAGDGDVAAIVRRAARRPTATRDQQADGGERWQEAGYWLVPLVALLVLASFRRESGTEVAA